MVTAVNSTLRTFRSLHASSGVLNGHWLLLKNVNFSVCNN